MENRIKAAIAYLMASEALMSDPIVVELEDEEYGFTLDFDDDEELTLIGSEKTMIFGEKSGTRYEIFDNTTRGQFEIRLIHDTFSGQHLQTGSSFQGKISKSAVEFTDRTGTVVITYF